MKRNILKRSIVGMAALCMLVSPAVSKASDDNHPFGFTIKAYQGDTYASPRYRQTTNTSNKWKVNLKDSSEGREAVMTFWLAKDSNNAVASGLYNVAQGTGAHYYNAKSNASQTDVKLGAENNNYTANTYTVSGVWDEETD